MTRRLGETHQARWTGNLRYMLKMLLCLEHFLLGPTQQIDLIAHCFYIVYIHVFFWFSATHMADIPFLTLTLRQDLVAWQARDPGAAQAALRKVDLHTEYLTGRSVILALASDQVDDATKDAMAKVLIASDREKKVEKGKPSIPSVNDNSKLDDFVNNESWIFFKVK